MEHHEVIEQQLVEQYLLNEMPPALTDAFEEHVFDCLECAAELKATSAFLSATRHELKKPAADLATSKAPVEVPETRRGRLLGWKQAVPLYALAACLLVMVYQNVVVYPKLQREVARLDAPEVLTSLSLIGGNSRGSAVPSVTIAPGESVDLMFDVPALESGSTYTCLLYSPEHSLLSTMEISSEQARDTVHIRIPGSQAHAGQYALQLKEHHSSGPDTDLAQYSFVLKPGPNH